MRILESLALAGFMGGAALCQNAPNATIDPAAGGGAAPLAFEVATIKPSEPLTPVGGRVFIRMGVTNDGQMVNYNRMSIRSLVRTAYGVKDYQVIGAPWMDTLQFDISAKMPEGATKEQAPEMLKTLLKERFKVTLHREQREHAIYALVAGKAGPKLVESKESASPKPPDGDSGSRAQDAMKKALSEQQIVKGAANVNLSAGGGSTFTMGGPGGGSHMTMKGTTMQNFADNISRYVSRPVIDETGIQGKYDFSLDLSADDMANARNSSMGGMMQVAMGGMIAMKGGAGGGGAAGPAPDAPPNTADGGSIYQSIQSYGLKLEPKKAPMDTIVIDGAEKSATEN
jgi:uncharacterized protein (TIGR03435 family)